MIARPARVRIRSRKPWVLDRRRLFGWNVRLLTRDSHYDDGAHPPVGGPQGPVRTAPRPGPGSWSLRTDRTARPGDRLAVPSEAGRDRPQTDPSIAEVRRLPVAGTMATAHDRGGHGPQARRRAGGRPAA